MKKTKIICTLSDLRSDPDFIQALYEAGMNLVRINTAHTTPDLALEVVKKIRQVSTSIGILIDTKGPEIRLNIMEPAEGVRINTGDLIKLKDDIEGICNEEVLYSNYAGLVNTLNIGDNFLIDDGDISLTVISKVDDYLVLQANNGGIIKGRKSINLPNVSVDLPSLTKKDREFILWAIENNIDFVAHSFVRSKNDLLEINEIIDKHNSHLKVISKIENQEGVDNIDEILDESYGVMIARGDLGIEIRAEKIPIIQKEIIHKCRVRKRPVIVATQMLHSMIENPRPTRAEVTDVANAVYEYTDAIMLSGETAYGKYPLEAVRTMSRIACEIESEHAPSLDITLKAITEPISVVLAKSIVEASLQLPMRSIIIDTMTGRTARYLSAFRPNIPIYAKCYREHVQRELALSYGVNCKSMEPSPTKDLFVKTSIQLLLEKGEICKSDLVGVLAGSFGEGTGASFIEIATVDDLIGGEAHE